MLGYRDYDQYYKDERVIPLGVQCPVYEEIIARLMPDAEHEIGFRNSALLCGMHPQNTTFTDFIELIEYLENLYDNPFHAVIADRNERPFATNMQVDSESPDIFYSHTTHGGSTIYGVQCDLLNPPFPKSSFSIIIADYTIGFMSQKQISAFARQTKELLTNDGVAIITYKPSIFPKFYPSNRISSSNSPMAVFKQFTEAGLKLTMYAETNYDTHDELMVFTHKKSQHNKYQYGSDMLCCLINQ